MKNACDETWACGWKMGGWACSKMSARHRDEATKGEIEADYVAVVYRGHSY